MQQKHAPGEILNCVNLDNYPLKPLETFHVNIPSDTIHHKLDQKNRFYNHDM